MFATVKNLLQLSHHDVVLSPRKTRFSRREPSRNLNSILSSPTHQHQRLVVDPRNLLVYYSTLEFNKDHLQYQPLTSSR